MDTNTENIGKEDRPPAPASAYESASVFAPDLVPAPASAPTPARVQVRFDPFLLIDIGFNLWFAWLFYHLGYVKK